MGQDRRGRADRSRIAAVAAAALTLPLLLPSLSNAQTFGITAALNSNSGTDTGNDSAPEVISDGDGNWLAVWTSNENLGGAGTDFDIFYSISSDDSAI